MEKRVDISDALQRLQREHQQADLRLKELDRHLSLSPDEQVEAARLKKQKLHLKDEIRQLAKPIKL